MYQIVENFLEEYNKNNLEKARKIIIDNDNFFDLCNKSSVLSNACRDPEKLDLVKFLINNGARVNYENCPLFLNIALHCENIECAKFLIDNGSLLDSFMLWTCSSHCYFEGLELLINNNIDINLILDKEGNNSLHHILLSGISNSKKIKCAELVINNGINYDHLNYYKYDWERALENNEKYEEDIDYDLIVSIRKLTEDYENEKYKF